MTENSANSAFGSTSERPYALRKRVCSYPGLPITMNRRRVVFNRHLSGECRLMLLGRTEEPKMKRLFWAACTLIMCTSVSKDIATYNSDEPKFAGRKL
jgi:hypothetical protein